MEKSYKSESYYDVTPIFMTSNLLDIADMLRYLRKPKIALLDVKNINELLYKGKRPFLENSFGLTSISIIPYDLLQKIEQFTLNKNQYIIKIKEMVICIGLSIIIKMVVQN